MTSSFDEIESQVFALEKEWQAEHELPAGMKLYHFTSAEGLAGILNSGALWATLATCLDDKHEIRAIPPLRHNPLIQSKPLPGYQDFWHLLSHKSRVDPDLDVVGAWQQAEGPFIVSFCAGRDWERVSNPHHWEKFGRGGRGYLLGFDYCQSRDDLDRGSLRLRKVGYEETEAESRAGKIRELERKIRFWRKDEHEDIKNQIKDSDGWSGPLAAADYRANGAWERLHWLNLELRACTKKREFSIENEHRLLVSRPSAPTQTRSSGGALAVYVELPVGIPVPNKRGVRNRHGRTKRALVLREIVFGPFSESRVSKAALQYILGDEKLIKGAVEIHHCHQLT